MSEAIILEEGILSGHIRAEGILSGHIFPEGILKGQLILPVGYEDYAGEYNVIPKIEAQLLPTADKHLTDNVTVEPIPYYEVSNPKGKTIIIGGN